MNCEYQEQVAVVNWCRANGIEAKSSLSGIYIKHQQTKITMKSLGIESGDPDLFFPYAKCGFHGLYIEMKRSAIYGSYKTDEAQIACLKRYNERGYLAVFGIGFDETVKIIEGYMNETLTELDIQEMIEKINRIELEKVKGKRTRSKKNVAK